MQNVAFADAEALQQREVSSYAEQAQADYEQARDGPAAKRDTQCRIDANRRRLSRANVRAHRDEHADITGEAGKDRADCKPAGCGPIQGNAEDHEQDHADDTDRHILAVHVGLGAFLDGRGNLLHALVAGGLPEDPRDRNHSVQNCEHGGPE